VPLREEWIPKCLGNSHLTRLFILENPLWQLLHIYDCYILVTAFFNFLKIKNEIPLILVQKKQQLLGSALKTAQALPVRDKSKSVMVVTGLCTVTYLFMFEFDMMLS